MAERDIDTRSHASTLNVANILRGDSNQCIQKYERGGVSKVVTVSGTYKTIDRRVRLKRLSNYQGKVSKVVTVLKV